MLSLVFVLAALLATREVSSPDVGFHLAAGARILDGHGWPQGDPFTYTVPDHPYIDTSWGYQVVLATAERLGEAPALVLLHVLLVLGTFVLVCSTARLAPASPGVLTLLLGLGVLASEMRFEVRPELWSWAFLALVLQLLERRRTRRAAPLWLLPVIFLVWANSHALFVLGLIALAAYLAGTALEARRLDRGLARWSSVALLACFLNPYGWRGVSFPLTLATRFTPENPFNQSIGEFRSPFALGLSEQFPFHPRLPIFAFRVLFVLALLAVIPLWRRRRFAAVLLWLPFAYLSFKMVRNMPLLAVTALPGTASAFVLDAHSALARAARRLFSAALALAGVGAVVLSLLVVHDAYYISNRREDRFGLGFSPLTEPIAATAFAARAGLDGPVLNHLNFGGYLIWARGRPVFIDGRLEVMGEAFYDEYRRILEDPQALEPAVARYGITWCIFPYRVAPRLLGRVSSDPHWVLVHVDPLAAVFARSGAGPPALELGRAPSAPPEVERLPGLGGGPRRGSGSRLWHGLWRSERFPTESFYLGLFHYWRGETVRAAALFADAVRESGGAYYEIYQNLGSALYRLERPEQAAACYRVVLEGDPKNRVARERLAEIERAR